MTKRNNIILLSLCVLLLAAAALLFAGACRRTAREAEKPAAPWRYAAGRVICVGDSLTAGSYFGREMGGVSIEQNYPHYLARMLNAEVTNAGFGGYSASDWYEKKIDEYDWSACDTVIVWLGTNFGPTDTLATDVLPYADSADYVETETGYYCRILDRIRAENPDCLILLVNVFASKSDVEETNRAIAAIAGHYALPLADMSDLGAPEHPELHAGSDMNPHFGKAGNLLVASRIADTLEAWFAADPLRCEYGIKTLEE